MVDTYVESNRANQTIEELALKCDIVFTQGERCQSNKVRIKGNNTLKLRMRALAGKQRLSLFWQLPRLRAVQHATTSEEPPKHIEGSVSLQSKSKYSQ